MKTNRDEDASIGFKVFSFLQEMADKTKKIFMPGPRFTEPTTPVEDAVVSNPMDQIIPIETWKVMSNTDREFFLDKFYPIRRKYLYEREGRELCAFEERKLHECGRNSITLTQFFSASDKNGQASDWTHRLDSCYDDRQEFRRCVLVMTMALKTEAVFGKDKRYLRVVDEESKQTSL